MHAGVHAAASVLERHTHDAATICSVQYGRFTEYYVGKAVDCDHRTLKVTPAGEPHWNRFAAVDTFGLRIDVDNAAFAGMPAVSRLLDSRAFFDGGAYALIARQLIHEMTRPDEVADLAIEALLLELVARMSRLHPRARATPEWLRRAHEMVSDLFRTPLTVEQVARAVDVSPTRLARAYRERYGTTIAQRVRALRLESAEQELVSGSAGLAEIALRAGFYDQSHFTTAYRRHFGITPAQRRRQAR